MFFGLSGVFNLLQRRLILNQKDLDIIFYSMKSTTKLRLWKFYFWIILINGLVIYLWQGFLRFWEFADLIIYSMALIGLFAFIWKKIIFSRLTWKIYFFIQILWNIFYLYFLPLPEKIAKSYEMSHSTTATITFIFYIPLFYGLYLYAFKNTGEISKVDTSPNK